MLWYRQLTDGNLFIQQLTAQREQRKVMAT